MFYLFSNAHTCRAHEELFWDYAIHDVQRIRVDESSLLPLSRSASPCELLCELLSDVQTPAKGGFSTSTQENPTNVQTPETRSILQPHALQFTPRAVAVFAQSQFDEFVTDDDEDAGDDAEKQLAVDDQIQFWRDGICLSDNVTGRLIGRKSNHVMRYVTATNGEVLACDRATSILQADTPRGLTPHNPRVDADGDDDVIDSANPSAVYAAQHQPVQSDAAGGLSFELGERDSAPMAALWKLFQQPKYRGGFLARSLFCEATKEKDIKVLPHPWNGGTSLKTKVAELKVQEQEWLNWTEHDTINEWVRKRVFSIIIANPRQNLTVTWKGRSTQMAFIGSAAITVTASHKCRIAHLAADPNAKLLIGLIYGAKDDRMDVEAHELRVTQLWREVAASFVNSPSWVPSEDMVLEHVYSAIDTTECPPSPGLEWHTVKELWMELRTDWSRLRTSTRSKTGASVLATGSLYDNVWKHFVCGNKMNFSCKVTAMYCFELWDRTENVSGLPQWCNRTLKDVAALSAGVESSATDSTATPTPKGKGKDGKEPPPVDSSARMCSLLESIVSNAHDGAKKFQELEAELRALQTASTLLGEDEDLKKQVAERIKDATRRLLARPLSSPTVPPNISGTSVTPN